MATNVMLSLSDVKKPPPQPSFTASQEEYLTAYTAEIVALIVDHRDTIEERYGIFCTTPQNEIIYQRTADVVTAIKFLSRIKDNESIVSFIKKRLSGYNFAGSCLNLDTVKDYVMEQLSSKDKLDDWVDVDPDEGDDWDMCPEARTFRRTNLGVMTKEQIIREFLMKEKKAREASAAAREETMRKTVQVGHGTGNAKSGEEKGLESACIGSSA